MARRHGRATDLTLVAALLMAPATLASGGGDPPAPPPDPQYVAAAGRLMSALQTESARHGAAIREAYGPDASQLALANRDALELALERGTLLTLPADLQHRNVRPRLTGRSPIGEADLPHQHLYVSARPETVGLLLEIAARVPTGPLDVTSLTRHHDYQRRLARANANARTEVPTHVMGLAVDISILYATLDHATRLRDVLRDMADAGDLLFVAEQRQLVFHVVPAPARREHFAALLRHEADRRLAERQPPPAARPDVTEVATVLAAMTPPLPSVPDQQAGHARQTSAPLVPVIGAWMLLTVVLTLIRARMPLGARARNREAP